jgi:phosphopantothenoylcysteine decarboxylase/phosphopantothenate--cysteine ligase
MENDMWHHPATQANLEKLRSWGVDTVGPGKGYLASGAQGAGRMSEPETVVEMVRIVLGRPGDLAGRQIVVTAGGTREAIDPVRYVSNHSSGKMGYALAVAARDRGARVTLVSSADRPAPLGVTVQAVDSAREMGQKVLAASAQADALIMAAAVADFRPVEAAQKKIKKQEGMERLTLELVRNPDILAEVAQQKEAGQGPTVTVGFAAETDELVTNAQRKLKKKKLDLIAANDVTASDAGFGVDTNRITLLGRKGYQEELPLLSKEEVAAAILDQVVELLGASDQA